MSSTTKASGVMESSKNRKESEIIGKSELEGQDLLLWLLGEQEEPSDFEGLTILEHVEG